MNPRMDRSAKAIYAVWAMVVICALLALLTSGCGCIYGWNLMQHY